jgi:hypothetical protein
MPRADGVREVAAIAAQVEDQRFWRKRIVQAKSLISVNREPRSHTSALASQTEPVSDSLRYVFQTAEHWARRYLLGQLCCAGSETGQSVVESLVTPLTR